MESIVCGVAGTRVFMQVGVGSDVDVAFDAAAAQAAFDYGQSGVVPSVAALSGTDIRVEGEQPVTEMFARRRAETRLGKGVEAGVAFAVPLTADATRRRRNTRLVVADVDTPLPHVTPGDRHTAGELVEFARSGAALSPGEDVEAVTVVSARYRYRPVASTFRGKSESGYAVLAPETGNVVAPGFRTAGDARRAAVEAAKQGPVDGSAQGALEVVKVTRRAGGVPFVRVARNLVSRRVVLKVTVSSVKNPDRPARTTGWLFYGRLPDPESVA